MRTPVRQNREAVLDAVGARSLKALFLACGLDGPNTEPCLVKRCARQFEAVPSVFDYPGQIILSVMYNA